MSNINIVFRLSFQQTLYQARAISTYIHKFRTVHGDNLGHHENSSSFFSTARPSVRKSTYNSKKTKTLTYFLSRARKIICQKKFPNISILSFPREMLFRSVIPSKTPSSNQLINIAAPSSSGARDLICTPARVRSRNVSSGKSFLSKATVDTAIRIKLLGKAYLKIRKAIIFRTGNNVLSDQNKRLIRSGCKSVHFRFLSALRLK